MRRETLEKANGLYQKVEEAHSELVKLIEKDDEFEVEEQWMLDCQKAFMVVKNETKKNLKEHINIRPEPRPRPNISNVNEGQGPTQEITSEAAPVEQSQANKDEIEPLTEQENMPKPKTEQYEVETGEKLSSLFETFSLSPRSTRVFSGDPLYFHSFVTSFTNIQFCNMKAPEEEFKMVMKKLKERFGDTARVAQAWIKKVTTRLKVHAGNIRNFADDLGNCYEVLNTPGYLYELNDQARLKKIMLKVPQFLQNRWSRDNFKIKIETGKNAELKDVVKFIRKAVTEITDSFSKMDMKASGASNHTSHRQDVAGNRTKPCKSRPNRTKGKVVKSVCRM